MIHTNRKIGSKTAQKTRQKQGPCSCGFLKSQMKSSRIWKPHTFSTVDSAWPRWLFCHLSCLKGSGVGHRISGSTLFRKSLLQAQGYLASYTPPEMECSLPTGQTWPWWSCLGTQAPSDGAQAPSAHQTSLKKHKFK